ncbi:MAG TPA: FliH/SctL family protein [Polyangiaceae bacterium]|jgi:flagellar biosynthesis/type III secretory pathway protein FliH|nr:FliH/SctL family protein [Polyangiaceae bacterium]
MKVGRGRVIKADGLTHATPVPFERDDQTLPRGQVVRREVLEAAERARQLIAAAEARASELVGEAERVAAELRLRAEAEARADASAKIAARALALRHHELQADERALDRSVEFARLLAERLLGESLRVAPEQVTALARQALGEARGARRITLVAHPEDAKLLEISLSGFGLDPAVAVVRADPARTRGNLRIETEIGVLDAELAPQLDRLSLKLRESLNHEQ